MVPTGNSDRPGGDSARWTAHVGVNRNFLQILGLLGNSLVAIEVMECSAYEA
jgi:hypothetical protein